MLRPVVEAGDRWWWARVIDRADIVDVDLVAAQGFSTARSAIRAYVRGGFRRGLTLNPLVMERLVASQLSDVGRVPALYAYLVNDPRRIQVNISWNAPSYASAHPECLTDPAGPLGHAWRKARADGSITLGARGHAVDVPWSRVMDAALAAVSRSRSVDTRDGLADVLPPRIFVCEIDDDERDLAYALDAVLTAAGETASALILAPTGSSAEAWIASALIALWFPHTRVLRLDHTALDALPSRSDGVVIVRSARSEISASSLSLLAREGVRGTVAPLWLDDDGTVASAGLFVRDGRYRHLLAGHPVEDVTTTEVIRVPRIAGATFARPLGAATEAQDRTLLEATVRTRSTPPPTGRVDTADTDLTEYLAPAGLEVRAWSGGVPLVRRPARRVTLPDGRSVPALRWAIKIAAPPGRPGEYWGDTHFARGVAEALRRLGQDVVIDAYSARDRPTAILDDVVLALRGPEPLEAQTGARSVLWVISHPDEITAVDVADFDLVFAASGTWASSATVRFGRPVHTLLQCTDIARFHPTGRPREAERVFVGTARGIARPSVVEPIRAGLPLSVYGPDWTGYIPAQYVVARSVPNDQLPALYESADAVLNDHWPAMQRAGFVSNRLFDVVAAGGRAISDHVDGIDTLFDGAVVTYRTIPELLDIMRGPLDRLFPDPARLAEISAEIRLRHSFDERASQLLAAVMDLG
jgi:hypothetical protein